MQFLRDGKDSIELLMNNINSEEIFSDICYSFFSFSDI